MRDHGPRGPSQLRLNRGLLGYYGLADRDRQVELILGEEILGYRVSTVPDSG
jgi:hypothetical protein